MGYNKVILGKCSVLQPSIKVSFASTSPWISDFSLKIILKNVQRTDLRYFYVKSVIVENVSFPEFKLIFFYLMIDFFSIYLIFLIFTFVF